MMKAVMRMLAIGFVLAAGPATAHEGHAHRAKDAPLVGEVVDITCYLDHESKGEKHATCAEKCITGGLPVGLLVGAKLYLIVMSDHTTPNAKLAPFAGKRVTVTGQRMERNGMRAIDLDTVELAPAAK